MCLRSTSSSDWGEAAPGRLPPARASRARSSRRRGPSETSTACSITFCSSRTLPGQSRAWSAWTTDWGSSSDGRDPGAGRSARTKAWARVGMSSLRCRSGGTLMGNTFSRYQRSSRKRPAATSLERFRLVAAMTRTSTFSVRSPPTRWKLPSWRTRSSFAWSSGDSSPTSSRKSVAPSASSKRPLRWDMGAGEGPLLVAEELALGQASGAGPRSSPSRAAGPSAGRARGWPPPPAPSRSRSRPG